MFIDVTYDRGVPEFFLPKQQVPGIDRIYGAEMDGAHDVFRYPAFFPFHSSVIHDLDLLFESKYEMSAQAQYEIERQAQVANNLKNWKYGVDVPDDFFRYKPYEHQEIAMVLATNVPRSGFLYDRGLGKTKTAIDIVRMDKLVNEAARTLIITPAVTIPNWCEEIDFHSFGEISPKVYVGKKGRNVSKSDDLTIVLTTYETMRAHHKALMDMGFHRIFFDESHRMRNPKSSTSQAAMELASVIPLRTIMTGSSHWDPRHLYTQLKILSPCLVPEGTFSKFKTKFLKYSKYNRYQVEGFKNMHILKKRMRACCLHRTKDTCLDLPERQVIPVYVDLGKAEAKAYNQVINEQSVTLGTDVVPVSEDSVFASISALLQTSRGWINKSNKDPEICDGCEFLDDCVKYKIKPYTIQCKVETATPAPTLYDFTPGTVLERAVEMASDILDEDPTNKILMWFRSNITLYKAQRMFKEYRVRHANEEDADFDLTNDTPAPIRHDADETTVLVGQSNYKAVVKGFETDPQIRILFGQIKCGIGINLTAANYTLYPELTMNPEDMEQSIDRNYRPGQKRTTTVYNFIANGTLDAGIAALLAQKTNIQAAIADPNFCKRCQDRGKCLLHLSSKPGTSECGLAGFVRRSSLKVRGTVQEDNDDQTYKPNDQAHKPEDTKGSLNVDPFDMMGDE